MKMPCMMKMERMPGINRRRVEFYKISNVSMCMRCYVESKIQCYTLCARVLGEMVPVSITVIRQPASQPLKITIKCTNVGCWMVVFDYAKRTHFTQRRTPNTHTFGIVAPQPTALLVQQTHIAASTFYDLRLAGSALAQPWILSYSPTTTSISV